MSAVKTKLPVLGVGVNPTTYAESVAAIMAAARERRSYAVTALATHGLMEAAGDRDFARVLRGIDVVTPDGQPVRWALNRLHDTRLDDRVYGPFLMLRLCAAAAEQEVAIYLYGSTPRTCELLAAALRARFPALRIAGVSPDRFREATPAEDAADVELITSSGAGLVFVGRGCPRQERWVAAHRGRVPAAMIAVGAAFDYIAGTLPVPPPWMQASGLEWLYRLRREPRRLWRRYLSTNSAFLWHFAGDLLRMRMHAGAGPRDAG